MFQDFFNFEPSTDELGNVLINIPPMSFRIDKMESNEIKTISVKLYETGDENLEFQVHPFFRRYISETEWDGVVSRQVAKYLLYYQAEDNGKVHSKSNKVCANNACLSWDNARKAIKETNRNYAMVNWHFISFFRMLTMIYLGTTDVYCFFKKVKTSNFDDNYYQEDAAINNVLLNQTGTTDNIVSHTGMNIDSIAIKLFNIDNALYGISGGGIFIDSEEDWCYSNLADFDINKGEGGIKTKIKVLKSTPYKKEKVWAITKMEIANNNPFLVIPTALNSITNNKSLNCSKMHHRFYSSKVEFYGNADSCREMGRGQVVYFGCEKGSGLNLGLFYSACYVRVVYAWLYDSCGCRICKLPL